jgi:GT2 family glycosyltransferase
LVRASGHHHLIGHRDFNGAPWLPACLASLTAQALADFELLILDNASSDNTVDLLRAYAQSDARVTLTESTQNLGFAAAHNQHISRAAGEFVLLLNQDVVLDEDFLAHACAAFEDRPRVASVQGRIRRLGASGEKTALIDSTGLVMHRNRRAVARRQGELETGADLIAGSVWGADGPAPVYRRAALLAATMSRTGGEEEVLDEDFFMYKEDVDLAWRLRRLGWQAWYEPSA